MAQTVQGYYYLHTPKPKTGRKLKTSELVGIEVELENVLSYKGLQYWKAVEDHSLKLNGREFTLLTYHNRAKTYLNYLFNVVKTAEISSRCSIHVHINALDMSLENIRVFLLNYLIFEKVLYNYSGKRWANIFCVPLYEWLSSDSFTSLKSFEAINHTWDKYSGLNLLSLSQHGTIEFRQMTGNKNPVYIQNWINMLVNLKKYSMDKTYEETVETILSLNSTSAYWYLVDAIFGKEAVALQYPTFKDDMETCISNAKLLITPWHEIKTLTLDETGEN